MAETERVKQTATEIMMKAMEYFGEEEPDQVIVIYNTKDGNLCMHSNALNHQIVGLCEYGKQSAMVGIFQRD